MQVVKGRRRRRRPGIRNTVSDRRCDEIGDLTRLQRVFNDPVRYHRTCDQNERPAYVADFARDALADQKSVIVVQGGAFLSGLNDLGLRGGSR